MTRLAASILALLTVLSFGSQIDAALVTVVSVERSYSGSANAVPNSGPSVSSTLDEMELGLGALPQILRTASSGDGTVMISRGESASASLNSTISSAEIVLETISGATKSATLPLVPAGNNARGEARVAFNALLDFSSNAFATPLQFTSDRFVFGNNTTGTATLTEQGGSVLFTSDVASLPTDWTITAPPNSILLLDIEIQSNSFNDFFRSGANDFDNQRLTLNITAVPEPATMPLLAIFPAVLLSRIRRRKRLEVVSAQDKSEL